MKNRGKSKKVKGSFKQAVQSTIEVKHCYCEGKQAIKNEEKGKVELIDPRQCGGSLFIDQCLLDQKLYTCDNRWDYAIDYKGEVFFFEVHTASSDQVSTVLKKLQWLKDWLNQKAPEINKLKSISAYYWVQSSGYHILPNSVYERLVVQKGLKPIPKLVLK